MAKRAKDKLVTVYMWMIAVNKGKNQELFGENICVKLDPFHVIQKITKTISKKHPYFHSCVQDLFAFGFSQ